MTRLRSAFIRPALALAAAASALALIAAPASAQIKPKPYYDGNTDIIVVAPRPTIVREESRRAQGGHSVEEISLTTTVSTAGLDLRYGADVDELHRRIRDTATELCDRIDAEMRGDSLTTDRECVRHAVRDAMAQADNLVAYYRG